MKTVLSSLAFMALATVSHAEPFTLSSPDIKADSVIDKRFEFNGFGCSGENMSPALSWKGAPKDAKAFAVTVYDPDAPTGSGWWHWLAINIPADVQALAANAGAIGGANLPKGASHGRSDFGFAGWGGVCPPQGGKPHRYIFTVHALKAPLEVPADATAALTGYFMGMNTIAKASFTATYSRAAAK